MIYDCFTFYNELELLDIRLHELYDIVDKFVLVEGNTTHSGKIKTSVWLENKDKFADVADKVVHHMADLTKYSTTEERENGQRNAIKDALEELNLDDQDIVTVCDLDEIPSKRLGELKPMPMAALGQKFCNYYLNNVTYDRLGNEKEWTLGRICRWWYLERITPQKLRMMKVPRGITLPCGWHFSFVGGSDKIKQKINVYLHQEFNNPAIIDNIDNALKFNLDVLGRTDRMYKVEEIDLPEYVSKNLDKFKHLFTE